jgi:hypothetical protein
VRTPLRRKYIKEVVIVEAGRSPVGVATDLWPRLTRLTFWVKP